MNDQLSGDRGKDAEGTDNASGEHSVIISEIIMNFTIQPANVSNRD